MKYIPMIIKHYQKVNGNNSNIYPYYGLFNDHIR